MVSPDFPDGGLHIFTATAPNSEPIPSDEGELAWKSLAWVQSAPDIVDNIPRFLPTALSPAPPHLYHFSYRNGQIHSQSFTPLPLDWIISPTPSQVNKCFTAKHTKYMLVRITLHSSTFNFLSTNDAIARMKRINSWFLIVNSYHSVLVRNMLHREYLLQATTIYHELHEKKPNDTKET